LNKILKNTAVAIATGSLIFSNFLPVALADLTLEISGNGSGSTNNVDLNVDTNTEVNQSNYADIQNDVNVSAQTGNNTANKNTGGDVSVDTGDSNVSVGVTNNANSNVAAISDCGGCLGDLTAKISGNGADSKNDVKVDSKSKTEVNQYNDAVVVNNVGVKSETGENEANKNTGGDVSVKTGDANVDDVSVTTQVNANRASVSGGSGGSGLSLWITGNGADSDNLIDLKLDSKTEVNQSNYADIQNDVQVLADSGDNTANKNTGGDVEIDTGDADVDVSVDNMANFNMASIDGCCLMDGTAKISGNGEGSTNDIKAKLASLLKGNQYNDLDCKGEIKDACADVKVLSETGENEADKNTGDPGGDPSIETGDAGASIAVDNSANANGLTVGGDVIDELEVDFPEGFPFSLDGLLGLLLLLWA